MRRRPRRLLLAFYPRSWRRQYGDEFLQLLDDLDADQSKGRRRRSFNVLLSALPIQLVQRQIATTVLIFFVIGVLAILEVYGPVGATSRESVVWGWARGTNPMITTQGHETYVSKGYTQQEGTRSPIMKFKATDQHGNKVTLDCRDGKCSARRRP
jgi:hypothetical protein